MSAETEATKQTSVRDETVKEEDNQICVHEGCIGGSTSVNLPSQQPDAGDNHVENVDNGLMPNLESVLTDTKDSMPDVMEMSTSVSETDADCICENNPESHTKHDSDSTRQCSDVSGEQCSAVDEKCNNASVDSVAADCVGDSDKHTTAASGGTGSLTHSSSDVGGVYLHDGEQDPSVHCDSHDDSLSTQSASDSCPSLSPALMNEVMQD